MEKVACQCIFATLYIRSDITPFILKHGTHNMKTTRTKVRLIGDILDCTSEAASVAYVTKHAKSSRSRVLRVMGTLVEQGLMERMDNRRVSVYKISQRGKDFLQEYRTFRQFVESFGMSI